MDIDYGQLHKICSSAGNLTMRTSVRRFKRLTNAFSKKIENHAGAAALYFMY